MFKKKIQNALERKTNLVVLDSLLEGNCNFNEKGKKRGHKVDCLHYYFFAF